MGSQSILHKTTSRPATAWWRVWLLCAAGPGAWLVAAPLPPPVPVDFHHPSEAARWKPDHDVARIRSTADGMEIDISGPDPFVTGPVMELPAGVADDTRWVLELKLRSEQGGMAEVFYFPEGGHAAAGKSATARVSPGAWQDVRLALPPLGRRFRLRIDPPGTTGKAVIASMQLRPRLSVPEPAWPAQVCNSQLTKITARACSRPSKPAWRCWDQIPTPS